MYADKETEPDAFTATQEYASRFGGDIGHYFLFAQKCILAEHIAGMAADIALGCKTARPSVLIVGASHGQMADWFLEQGYEITLHGSKTSHLAALQGRHEQNQNVRFLVCPFDELRMIDSVFDVVVCLRVLAHYSDWKGLINDCTRKTTTLFLGDYSPRYTLGGVENLLFGVKNWLEDGTARPYNKQTSFEIQEAIHSGGFELVGNVRQFFIPMAVHRSLGHLKWTLWMEQNAKRYRLTSKWGRPCIFAAKPSPSNVAASAEA